MKSKVALIPAKGMGDALLFTILGHNAHQVKMGVTVFHRMHEQLKALFPPHFDFQPPIEEKELEDTLSTFSTTYFQNDHSSFAYHLHSCRKRGDLDIRYILPKPSALYRPMDVELDPHLTMVENLQHASLHLFGKNARSNGSYLYNTWNGQASTLVYIHPFSGNTKKNYTPARYIDVATRLEKKGLHPVFIIGPEEADFPETPYSTVIPQSLSELASLLQSARGFIGNDSGPGHLASLIGTPTVTIGGNPYQLRLWRPGWNPNITCSPRIPLPNFKGIGLTLRDNYWQYFVQAKRIVKAFESL